MTVAPEQTSSRSWRHLLEEARTLDWRAAVILISVPLLLIGVEYGGIRIRSRFWQIFSAPTGEWAQYKDLFPHWWWVGTTLVLNLAVPLLIGLLVLRMRPRDLGFRLRGTTRGAWVYPVLYLLVLPFVFYASTQPRFLETYPFYRDAGRSLTDLVYWEVAYALQFITVEFFYRGYLVLGLKRRLGPYSVLVMLAPYCMIHFHKPWQEAFGAIVAGVVLGTLAYRTGTVIYGILLHYGVALTMDLLALAHTGQLHF